MVVHLHALCWNEADMLGFFFRHYDPWVDRYFIHDDGSTDGSIEILDRHPRVELRSFEHEFADSYVDSSRHFYEHAWRESRGQADWVVNTQVDEHLWFKGGADPRAKLAELAAAGVTAVPAIGFQMLSEEMPDPSEHLASTRTTGARFAQMDKLNLFDPNAIEDPNFSVGRHTASPTGTVRNPPNEELLLLHYKYVGYERVNRRHAELSPRLKERDREQGWGHRYHFDERELRADWDRFAAEAIDVRSV